MCRGKLKEIGQSSGCPLNPPNGSISPYIGHMKNNTTQTSLFSQGWKAEQYFGSELTATHMRSASVYRFIENNDISIKHTAVRKDNEWVDQFVVYYRTVTAYHESGNVLSTENNPVETFDKFLDAYYCGVQCVNNLNMDLIAN